MGSQDPSSGYKVLVHAVRLLPLRSALYLSLCFVSCLYLYLTHCVCTRHRVGILAETNIGLDTTSRTHDWDKQTEKGQARTSATKGKHPYY